jgi:hypothetical protein
VMSPARCGRVSVVTVASKKTYPPEKTWESKRVSVSSAIGDSGLTSYPFRGVPAKLGCAIDVS